MATWVWGVKHTALHTPGPWVVVEAAPGQPCAVQAERDAVDADDVGRLLCELWKRSPIPPDEFFKVEIDSERDANAQLMADAPHMLLLLAHVVEWFERVYPVKDNGHMWAKGLLPQITFLLRRHVRLGIANLDDTAGMMPVPPEGP